MQKLNELKKNQVIVLADNISKNPGLICSVCCYMSRDIKDSISIREHEACTECYINFRHLMGNEWDKGVRPTLEEARYKIHSIIKA